MEVLRHSSESFDKEAESKLILGVLNVLYKWPKFLQTCEEIRNT